MIFHVSMAEGFSFVILSDVVGSEFSGVCVSSEKSRSFLVLPLEVETYCDTCCGIIVKIVINIFLN